MREAIEKALEALSAASDCIGIDMTALADAHFDQGLGRVDDEGQAGLDDYDKVLGEIDEAVDALRGITSLRAAAPVVQQGVSEDELSAMWDRFIAHRCAKLGVPVNNRVAAPAGASELPPLPKPCYPVGTGKTLVGFSLAQMREYARAALSGAPAVTAAEPLAVLRDLIGCVDTYDRLRRLHEMGHGTDHDGTRRRFNETVGRARALLAATKQPAQVPVGWRVRGYSQFKTGAPGPWRYFDGPAQPKINDPECCDIEPVFATAPSAPAAPVVAADAVRDAQRLDWLDATNKRFSMGWKVGIAPPGNVGVQAVIQLAGPTTTIRDAIDAARKEAVK